MPENSRSRRKMSLLAIVSALALASLCVAGGLHWRTQRLLEAPFRIGFNNTATEHFRGPNGEPEGNSVDLMNEAARRGGIKLEWIYSPEGPDVGLGSGELDLWPVIVELLRWGDRHAASEAGPPIVLRHKGCGGELGERRVCMRCGESLQASDVRAEPGPGAGAVVGVRRSARESRSARPAAA